MPFTRRSFLYTSSLTGASLLLPRFVQGWNTPPAALHQLCQSLLQQWTDSFVKLQVKDKALPGLYGGIQCPACAMVHGRSGDAILPLLYQAKATGSPQFVEAAIRLFEWQEQAVSMPDGSWVNELTASSWAGTTVFSLISLCKSLMHFEELLPAGVATQWKTRMRKAADYIFNTFSINTGNINYPCAGAYAMVLAGTYLQEPRYTRKGQELAQAAVAWFTPLHQLVFREGKPAPMVSKRGCYPIDLGYNVEETLPALLMYARHVKDASMEELVIRSMRSHLAFMLPDGAWDNSWGTRNYKWTYWGSRTSDGCTPAYALAAASDPAFYEAALRNTQLLERCTHDGMLYGGPHQHGRGILPCIHHSLGHSVALASTLLYAGDMPVKSSPVLPREIAAPLVHFPEISTWLVNKNKWLATVTANDQEYSFKGGHASGGVLSLLWHPKTGPLLCAGMQRYQLVESTNMQRDKEASSMNLTPRFELVYNGIVYTSAFDPDATVATYEENNALVFSISSYLMNENKQHVPDKPVKLHTYYRFDGNRVHIQCTAIDSPDASIRFYLPLISAGTEKITRHSDRKIAVQKEGNTQVIVESSAALQIAPTGIRERVFQLVPGLEAIPLYTTGAATDLTIYLL